MTGDDTPDDAEKTELREPPAGMRQTAQRLCADIVESGLAVKNDNNDIMMLLGMVLYGVIQSCVQEEFQDHVLTGVTDSTRMNLAGRRDFRARPKQALQ